MLDDGTIESLTPEQVDRVLRPKVDAAVHLDEFAGDAHLILFSSIAAMLGAPGQGNYSAANAFLDALAERRQSNGRPATALAWGPWEAAGGMTRDRSAADLSRMRRAGLAGLPIDLGLALFDAALTAEGPVVAPARLDSGALRTSSADGNLAPVLRGLVRTRERARQDAAGTIARGLSQVPESRWGEIVLDVVREQIAAVVGLSSGQVEAGQSFKEMGFDSLDAVDLRNRMIKASGLQLPATLMFDHPTPAAVAEYLRSRLAEHAVPPREPIEEALERVEVLLADVVADAHGREEVQQRLHVFNSRVQSMLSGANGDEPDDLDEDLTLASDQEMFELIDKELGST